METLIGLSIAIAWYFCGMYSFIYWWIKDFDLTREDFLVCCFIGAPLGILMHPLGWLMHRENKKDERSLGTNPVIIIKQRGK